MTIEEAMERRHSVRAYTDRKIPEDIVQKLREEIETSNRESGLNMQLVLDDEKAFDSMMARYGKFSGVRNYVAMVGPKTSSLEETCGYYGERLVLAAQMLGLNSCWVGMTFAKGVVKKRISIEPGEKLLAVISLGYGETQGAPHRSKPLDALSSVRGTAPEWFWAGMKGAALAPTAVNQQKFRITWDEGKLTAKSLGGFYSKTDLGIVKYQFEAAAGKTSDIWRY